MIITIMIDKPKKGKRQDFIVLLFNGKSTFLGYSMPNPSF